MRHFLLPSVVMTALLSGVVQARNDGPDHIQLVLDGRDLGTFSSALSGGHLLLPLAAFAALGWRPVLDPYSGVVDLAGCVRVRTTGREAYLIGGPGVIGVRTVSTLPPLPVAVQLRQGTYHLPAKALAHHLHYTVLFDKKGRLLHLSTPTDPGRMTPTTEACLRTIGRGP